MAIGKANAKRDRERGSSTVRVYATATAMYTARGWNVRPGTWEHCLAMTRAGWQSDREDAIAQYRFDVFGDQWEGL